MKNTIILLGLFYMPLTFSLAFSQSAKDKNNVVIIKNQAVSESQADPTNQSISAPALVPGAAGKLRKAREQQEINTEDAIIKELEKQRLIDEQKRLDKILGSPAVGGGVSPPPTTTTSPPVESEKWFFGNKAFLSIGVGYVVYPKAVNVNSMNLPAFFASFGGYGYKGRLVVDFSYYLSTHYVNENCGEYDNFYNEFSYQEGKQLCQPSTFPDSLNSNSLDPDLRLKSIQNTGALGIKYLMLTGKMKPYVGLSSSLSVRNWTLVYQSGEPLDPETLGYETREQVRDVSEKSHFIDFSAGLAVGADIVFGDNFGLNVDARYHKNLFTDIPIGNFSENKVPLAKLDSLVVSMTGRYYF